MRKELYSIIKVFHLIVICVILTLLPGCINNNNRDGNNSHEFEYKIKINSTSEMEYIIITPLVINYRDEITSKIMNQIEISGECDYSFEQTIYGSGLNISGKGNITITSSGNTFEEYGILSLKFDSDGDGSIKDEGPKVEYWYYYQTQENLSINLEINCRIRHGPSSYYSNFFKTEISSNGWNKANGKETIWLP